MCRINFGASILPISVSILMFACIIITYVTSVLKNDVYPLFPYISDTGVKSPERCLFSEFINLAAFFAVATLFTRYKIINRQNLELPTEYSSILKLSRIGFLFAIISCFGLTLVANFQETSVKVVHLTGACLVFAMGIIFQFIDAKISYKLHPVYNNLVICHTRLLFAIIGLLSLIVTAVSGFIAYKKWGDFIMHDKRHWRPGDPGYTAHVTSSVAEWINALSFIIYFFTYINEFRKITLNFTIVSINNENSEYESIEESNPIL